MANRTGQHRWFFITRKLSFQYCGKCGLIILRNRKTQNLVNAACKDRDKDED